MTLMEWPSAYPGRHAATYGGINSRATGPVNCAATKASWTTPYEYRAPQDRSDLHVPGMMGVAGARCFRLPDPSTAITVSTVVYSTASRAACRSTAAGPPSTARQG